MTKSNFKKSIQERYKGRGNTWVKVEKDTEAYQYFDSVLKNITDASSFIEHITREGFGWLRFSKVIGNESNPIERFELRYRGSKEDHPDTLVDMPHHVAKEMSLLGNTPKKLQLETDPSNRKTTFSNSNRKKEENNVLQDVEVNLNEEIRIIKEAVLTKPTNKELESWYDFLRVNDLYEDNV